MEEEVLKTRVTRSFNFSCAMYIYKVEKWAEWDAEFKELRRYYPGRAWRYVRSYPIEAHALAAAQRVARYGDEAEAKDEEDLDVIAEYGD